MKEIADCESPAVSKPSLKQMVPPIVQHVAALAESAQIPQLIVRWIAVHVRRRKHDACYPKPSRLHQVGPTGSTAPAIAPCRCLLVEPAPVW